MAYADVAGLEVAGRPKLKVGAAAVGAANDVAGLYALKEKGDEAAGAAVMAQQSTAPHDTTTRALLESSVYIKANGAAKRRQPSVQSHGTRAKRHRSSDT